MKKKACGKQILAFKTVKEILEGTLYKWANIVLYK